jgi:tetratricopeptide (TPR) repeat protein
VKLFDNERDVLPSWLTSEQASGLPELKPLRARSVTHHFERLSPSLTAELEASPSVGVAVELLNVAVTEHDAAAARKAAEYLKRHNFMPDSISRLISQTLGDPLPLRVEPELNPIGRLKRLLHRDPNNPLVWANLSREYAIFGDKERSIKAMQGALHTGMDHRWITRIAARVCVHFEEPDRAHALILRNGNIRSDPWLIATEMAVSRKAEKQSKLLSIGKNFLESNISARHLSELASSFATQELRNGAEKKAKKLFKQSLIEPNQNALAQAKWAERSSGLKKLVETPAYENVAAYEAQYWEAYSKKDMQTALQYAKQWFNEEPYSSGPAIAISYLASLLDDYALVEKITTKGLVANPNNWTLKLNQIFAWIASNNLRAPTAVMMEESKWRIQKLEELAQDSDWQVAAHAIANIGMLLYRTGDIASGKQRYEMAEEIYKRHASQYVIVIKTNHLREALISDAPWAVDVLKETHSLLGERTSNATPGAEYYLEKINQLADAAGTWAERLIPSPTETQMVETVPLSPETPPPTSEAILSKFWLPESFSSVDSLRQFTDKAIAPVKNKR